jgi:hypothetical protein
VTSWVLTGLLVLLLAVGLLTATLALAWRVVERRAGYRRVGPIGAYVFSGAWLGWSAGVVVASTAVHLIDPGWLQHAVASLHASRAASAPVPMPSMERLDTAPMRAASIVLLALGAVIWLATALWCVVAWGAFRRSLAATRLQAWLATSIWIAMLAAMVWLPLQLV